MSKPKIDIFDESLEIVKKVDDFQGFLLFSDIEKLRKNVNRRMSEFIENIKSTTKK